MNLDLILKLIALIMEIIKAWQATQPKPAAGRTASTDVADALVSLSDAKKALHRAAKS